MLSLQTFHGFGLAHCKLLLAAARGSFLRLLLILPTRRTLIAAGMLYVAITGAKAQGSQLEIRSQSGVHLFTVEIALTRDEQARGLMFRKNLAADHGMLFYFKKVSHISIWMKNTYIP